MTPALRKASERQRRKERGEVYVQARLSSYGGERLKAIAAAWGVSRSDVINIALAEIDGKPMPVAYIPSDLTAAVGL